MGKIQTVNIRKIQTMNLSSKTFHRFLDIEKSAVNEDKRTISLAFSSEKPVYRDFGYEVLDHSPKSIDLTRLRNGAPLLVDHNMSDHVGVVESVSIGQDKIGRAVVRFGSSTRATEVFNDVRDGIRRNVSVGYQIQEVSIDESARGADHDTYRVTKWMPFEVSIVSIPADESVGVGRSIDTDKVNKMIDKKEESKTLTRVNEILLLGKQNNALDLAQRVIENGGKIEHLQRLILERNEDDTILRSCSDDGFFSNNNKQGSAPKPKERDYSISNVIRSMCGDKSVDIGFELEVSQEFDRTRGRKSDGFSIPMSALSKRDFTAAGAGSDLIGTTYHPEHMVDFLRNKSVIMNAGAMNIAAAQGNIIIPRQIGSATAEWLTLDGTDEITASNPAFDQIELSMKTLTAMTTYTHAMLKQGLPDIDSLIRDDLARLIAQKLDEAALNGSAIDPKQPTGVLNQTGVLTQTVAGSAPTFEEIIGFEGALADNNTDVQRSRYLTSPALAMALKSTAKDAGSGQMLWTTTNEREGNLNGFGAVYTNSMPAGQMLFGNFNDVIIGNWGGLDIMADPYGNNFSKKSVSIRATFDMDIAVRRPESFCKVA